jgi:hypothetical protein
MLSPITASDQALTTGGSSQLATTPAVRGDKAT